MTMINKELLELNAVLSKLSNFGKTKFKYTILKNIELLKPNTTVLLELEKTIREHISEFDKEKNQLILKVGKNQDDVTYIDLSDKDMVKLFNKEMEDLKQKYVSELNTFNEKMEEFKGILQEKVENTGLLLLKSININDLPEDNISIEELVLLDKFNLVQDEEKIEND